MISLGFVSLSRFSFSSIQLAYEKQGKEPYGVMKFPLVPRTIRLEIEHKTPLSRTFSIEFLGILMVERSSS